ncbi:MAG TPA: cytochrome C, partial [Myxococcota bacterium]
STLDAARAQPVGDDGYNSIMPWWTYANMSEEDLGAIYDFLHAQAPVKNAVIKWSVGKKAAAAH